MTSVARQTRRSCNWVVNQDDIYSRLPTPYANYDTSVQSSVIDNVGLNGEQSAFNKNDIRGLRDVSSNNRHLTFSGLLVDSPVNNRITYTPPIQSGSNLSIGSLLSTPKATGTSNGFARRLEYVFPTVYQNKDFTLSFVASFAPNSVPPESIFSSATSSVLGSFQVLASSPNIVVAMNQDTYGESIVIGDYIDKLQFITITQNAAEKRLKAFVNGVKTTDKILNVPLSFVRLSCFTNRDMNSNSGANVAYMEFYDSVLDDETVLELARYHQCKWGL